MADRGTLRTKAVRRAKAREAPLPKPGPAQFPRLRRAICKALDAGRHWTARNTIAACGTWRELEALIERDLPTHDARVLQVRFEPDGTGLTIVRYDLGKDGRRPAHGEPIAKLTDGVDY